MGGTPVVQAARVTEAAEAKAMLQAALADERATVDRYVRRRRQAEEAGEYGLAIDLDTMIADESKHRDELELMLARWD